MRLRSLCRIVLFVVVVFGTAILAFPADTHGRIEGRVLGQGDTPLGGVTVVVHETRKSTLTDRSGNYSFSRVPAGTYTLVFSYGDDQVTKSDVVVTGGASTLADFESDWKLTFAESLTVFSASRRQERIVDAPAAVTVISEEQIEREASHGQLPKLLEFTPGAEVTQSGIYDYNFNVRGFNSSLNRRVATLIDGRDPSVPFLGAQEWAAVSFPLDDLAGAELVRGPSAALYGANASSGVLNLTTKQPRYSQGLKVRLTGGQQDTINGDVRYADGLGAGWYFKINAGVRSSGDFTVSRNGAAEYSVPCTATGQTDCLPQEAVPLDPLDDDQITFGNLRFDKHMNGGGVLSLEAGTADVEGPVFQTGIGRVQLNDVKRPWARANYSMNHWNFLAYYSARDAKDQTALASGAKLVLDTYNITGEFQTNWDFADERVRLVAGASYTEEDIDSLDPATGSQTLMFRPVDSDSQAVFAQVDVRVHDKVKLVFAGRFDDSSLHDSQVSPKASVVYNVNQDHTLRATYNEAFQVANYSEFFLEAPVAPNADLSAFEGICQLNGVTDCGLAGAALGGPGTSVLALGNDDLQLEEITTWEIGYAGVLAKKAFLTIDYYRSKNENFITDLVSNVGTSFGRINPDFGPWVGSTLAETTTNTLPMAITGIPPGLSVAETIRLLCGGAPTCGGLLSNNLDGSNIIAAVSYTNFGEVDTQGADLGLSFHMTDRAKMSFSYSWFDFDLKESATGFEDLLLPNSPENKLALGYFYGAERWSGSVNLRWVGDFRWVVGPFQGDVESYTTADVGLNFDINDNWAVGANVANAFDDVHIESFGGDLLERRALAYAAFSWQ